MISHDFQRQLGGYGLTTAHILYRLPDHQDILQSYIWQDYDLYPEFPTLRKFISYWNREIEGPLYSVTITHAHLIKPAEIRIASEFRLH